MTINASTGSAGSSLSKVNGIGMQDFLKILTSQMSNQDPLKPLDNQQFIAQIAQFSALEQSQQLNQKIAQLLSVQSVSQSVGLLGKTVELNSAGNVISGQVTALALASGQPELTVLSGTGTVLQGIGFSQILTIR
jgi:flagellar basal-body rod modification protein FlgD